MNGVKKIFSALFVTAFLVLVVYSAQSNLEKASQGASVLANIQETDFSTRNESGPTNYSSDIDLQNLNNLQNLDLLKSDNSLNAPSPSSSGGVDGIKKKKEKKKEDASEQLCSTYPPEWHGKIKITGPPGRGCSVPQFAPPFGTAGLPCKVEGILKGKVLAVCSNKLPCCQLVSYTKAPGKKKKDDLFNFDFKFDIGDLLGQLGGMITGGFGGGGGGYGNWPYDYGDDYWNDQDDENDKDDVTMFTCSDGSKVADLILCPYGDNDLYDPATTTDTTTPTDTTNTPTGEVTDPADTGDESPRGNTTPDLSGRQPGEPQDDEYTTTYIRLGAIADNPVVENDITKNGLATYNQSVGETVSATATSPNDTPDNLNMNWRELENIAREKLNENDNKIRSGELSESEREALRNYYKNAIAVSGDLYPFGSDYIDVAQNTQEESAERKSWLMRLILSITTFLRFGL